MRLKSLTTLNTTLLIAICFALGATLWWSEQALERPYQLMGQYLSLSQRFQHQVANNIHDYLSSGDTVRHKAALTELEGLAADVSALPGPFANRLQPSLEQLHQFAATELLAAGKLAGDPQGLLLQAEREIAGTLEQLHRYAAQGQHEAAGQYQQPLFEASRQLLRLSHARAKLTASGNDELAAEVEQALQAVTKESQMLEALPLLGQGLVDDAPQGVDRDAEHLVALHLGEVRVALLVGQVEAPGDPAGNVQKLFVRAIGM